MAPKYPWYTPYQFSGNSAQVTGAGYLLTKEYTEYTSITGYMGGLYLWKIDGVLLYAYATSG